MDFGSAAAGGLLEIIERPEADRAGAESEVPRPSGPTMPLASQRAGSAGAPTAKGRGRGPRLRQLRRHDESLRLGRVQGLLEAGVLAGYWRKRDSAAAAELVQHRYRLSKLRDVLLRGDEVKLWKVTDIAEFLAVSTQRVDQLALAGRFPAPSGRLGRARYWERRR